MKKERFAPVPTDLDTDGLNLDALLEIASEKGYSMDELVAHSGIRRKPLGGVVGDVPQPA